MRLVFRYIAVLLVFLMTPAAGEVAENIVHFVVNGHTAHAVDDAAHQPDDREHGCSGLFHVCGCHSSVPFTVTRTSLDLSFGVPAERELHWWHESSPKSGHGTGVFRPPII